jgi:hypothetical protein
LAYLLSSCRTELFFQESQVADLKVVSERSEADLVRERSEALVADGLKSLTSNLMRVVRGAGDPADVFSQTAEVLKSFEEHRNKVGQFPSAFFISETLKSSSGVRRLRQELRDKGDNEALDRWSNDGTFDRMRAQHQICRGVLQIIASEFLGQNTQITAGEKELVEGVRAYEATYKERR